MLLTNGVPWTVLNNFQHTKQIKIMRCQVRIPSYLLVILKKHRLTSNAPVTTVEASIQLSVIRTEEEFCRTQKVNRKGVTNNASASKGSSRTSRPRAIV